MQGSETQGREAPQTGMQDLGPQDSALILLPEPPELTFSWEPRGGTLSPNLACPDLAGLDDKIVIFSSFSGEVKA